MCQQSLTEETKQSATKMCHFLCRIVMKWFASLSHTISNLEFWKNQNTDPSNITGKFWTHSRGILGNIVKTSKCLKILRQLAKNTPTEMKDFGHSKNSSRIPRGIFNVFLESAISENVSRIHQEYHEVF